MSDQRAYLNFDIRVRSWDGAHYRTRVLQSPAGESQGALALAAPDVIANLKVLRALVLDGRGGPTSAERAAQARNYVRAAGT
ncbi:MAG TPA: hypothetical protein VNL77_02590 [Roseiflexaceae bacterium]|nr:hypothetical protein [Roseiflexaceae bacterium]